MDHNQAGRDRTAARASQRARRWPRGGMVPLLAVLALLLGAHPALAGTPCSCTVAGPYAAQYTATDLGTPAGVPANLGGLRFKPGDPNTLLIGGNAETPSGALYQIAVTRDGTGRITGFSGSATKVATAPQIDGGLDLWAPGNVLFFTGYPTNQLGEIKPGTTSPGRTIDLTSLGYNSSVGSALIVPAGLPGAGELKLLVYTSNDWYSATATPDGSGTFNVSAAGSPVHLVSAPSSGGPEGAVYVPAGSPAFATASVLVAEFRNDRISAYQVDGNGDPLPTTRTDFVTGLRGAEGATLDPLTNDYLFSTYGGNDRVILVTGFAQPAPGPRSTPEAPSSILFGAGAALVVLGLGARNRRRRKDRPTA